MNISCECPHCSNPNEPYYDYDVLKNNANSLFTVNCGFCGEVFYTVVKVEVKEAAELSSLLK